MAKNKAGRFQASTVAQMQRAVLASAETSPTGSSPDGEIGDPKNRLSRTGEKVAVPSSEMMGTPADDKFSKYGFFLALMVASCGAIWMFADTYFAVKTMGEDVKLLQRKAEEFFRLNANTEGRISALERAESRNLAPANGTCQ